MRILITIIGLILFVKNVHIFIFSWFIDCKGEIHSILSGFLQNKMPTNFLFAGRVYIFAFYLIDCIKTDGYFAILVSANFSTFIIKVISF